MSDLEYAYMQFSLLTVQGPTKVVEAPRISGPVLRYLPPGSMAFTTIQRHLQVPMGVQLDSTGCLVRYTGAAEWALLILQVMTS